MKQQLLTVLASLCLAFASAQIPTAGLVAYWPLNGNLTDAGPNGLNGTINGATAGINQNGQANSALSFSNPSTNASTVAQFALLPTSSLINYSGTQNFSIVFWMYVNAPVIHPGGMYENNLNTAGPGVWMWTANGFPQIQFNYKNASIGTPNGAFTTAGWYNVACLRNNGTLSTYINGVLKISGPEGTIAPTYPIQARLGTMSSTTFPPANNYNGFNGRLDELRIYNRALSAAEITILAAVPSGGPLPIKLSNFTAAKNSADVLLQWQTEYEQNSDYYTIQQSTDGINFTNIGKVQAKGTSSVVSSYQFTDNSISILTNAKALYYRLVSADKDGRSQNSNIISVRMDAGKPDGLMVLQNPVTDQLNLQLTSSVKQNGTIIITDVSGRQLISKSVPLQNGTIFTAIPVHMLAAGNYYITLINSSGKQTKSFIRPSL
jgi:hypothetical protein